MTDQDQIKELEERIRDLEEIVSKQAKTIKRYRQQDDARKRQADRQARWDADYVGYQEDEYDR